MNDAIGEHYAGTKHAVAGREAGARDLEHIAQQFVVQGYVEGRKRTAAAISCNIIFSTTVC
jgi:hypothetical protein